MARTKACPRCKAENDPEGMFCMECGDQLEKSDRFKIEKKAQKAHCQDCGHYNPIEADKCESCGAALTGGKGAVVRDEHGRLRLIREPPLKPFIKFLCLVAISAMLTVAIRAGWFQWVQAKGVPRRVLDDPAGQVVVGYLAVALAVLVTGSTSLVYKTQALFGVALTALYFQCARLGGSALVWETLSLDRLVLIAHVLALGYALVFLMRHQLLGGGFTICFSLVGFWCAYPALVATFEGAGFQAYMSGRGDSLGLPVMASPLFLCFHLFLPYVGLQMLGEMVLQWAASRQFVATNPTDKAVLAELRRRNLRGLVLNLFAAGVPLLAGLFELHRRGQLNMLTPVLELIVRLKRG